MSRYLPILSWAPSYRRSWLRDDAVAALSVWALLVPQALAYATIAGIPVQFGLYAAFAALLAYAVFGTSRQMVQGPSATVAAVTAAVITPLIGASALGTDKAAAFAAALALATGAIYLLLGALRMGWVSNFLSKAVLAGFILGFAVGIVIGQSYNLLGVEAPTGSYVEQLVETVKSIPDTDLTTLLVGTASLALLLGMRALRPRWPRALIVVVLATALAGILDLAGHGVALTGKVPTGLFEVGLPGVGWADTGALLLGGLAVIFVGFSESLASARTISSRRGYEIDPNQELIAQGAACGAAGFVGGFATDGSLSKSSVADAAGQRTQMASLINASFLLLTLLFLAGLFKNLPSATLGAIVIDAMVGLITLTDMKRYLRVNRADWVFFIGAMTGILLIGIIAGILIGVVLSLLLLIARASSPAVRRLGRDPKTGAYLNVARHSGLELSPETLVVRIDGPLFFADANQFRLDIRQLIEEQAPEARVVVIDAAAISQTDTDGADILIQLAAELKADRRVLALARCESHVLELWQRAGVIDALGADRVFVAIDEAVGALASR